MSTRRDRLMKDPEVSWKSLLERPPAIRLEQRIYLGWNPAMRLAIWTLRQIIALLARWFFGLQVRGVDKLPEAGPLLICPNHQSAIDPVLLAGVLPQRFVRRLLFVGYGPIFRRAPYRWVTRFFRVLATGSQRRPPEGLKLAYDGLRRGMVVCMFPEGGRTTTGQIMEPRVGAGVLACEANAPIVPVLIEGALDVLSLVRPGIRRCRIRITFGEPIQPVAGSNAANQRYQEMVDRWKQALARMSVASSEALCAAAAE